MITEASGWESQASILRQFLENVKCCGGGDEPEAVDVALRRALSEPELSRKAKQANQQKAEICGLTDSESGPLCVGD